MQIPEPGTTLGHYRIERMIGQGGMGVVYAATDLRLGREVALKVITGPLASTDEFRRRFHHEALAMSRVQSPWIVQIHDHDEVDGFPYIVTQFIAGTDLGSLIEEQERLTARRALRVCAQLARGLDDAHRAGVLHRDVKPGNVLVSDPGSPHEHAFLCDFGIAISDAVSHLTATGMVAGTWAYLAPERTLGAAAVPASDLYAAGCVLWTCLTGRPPYVGTEVQMAVAHANAPIPQLPGTDNFVRALNALLTRVLAKEPGQRQVDGAALAAELEGLAVIAPDSLVEVPVDGAPSTVIRGNTPDTAAVPPRPPSPPPPAAPQGPTQAAPSPRSARRRKWPLVVGGIVAVALLGGIAVWGGLAARDDDEAPDGKKREPAPVDLVSGDLDGDGLGDVAAQVRADSFGTTTDSTGTLTRLISTGTTLGPAVEVGTETGALLLGDVDADGRMDQVWFMSTSGSAAYRVRVITGTDDIWEHPEELTATARWGDLVPFLADVDGDGRDDLLFTDDADDDSGTSITVHAALAGDESFGVPETVLDLGRTIHPITGVGDFDGDGDDDLFRATNTQRGDNITGVEIQPFRNDDGAYTALEPSRPDVDTWGVGWFVAGDPDGDGVDEVVVTNGRNGAIGVLEYDDDGFGDVTEWMAGTIPEDDWEAYVFDNGAPHFRQALSDVDGDGDDDVVATRERKGAVEIGIALSDGDSFAEYQDDEWGSIPCPSEGCGGVSLVANVEPSIL